VQYALAELEKDGSKAEVSSYLDMEVTKVIGTGADAVTTTGNSLAAAGGSGNSIRMKIAVPEKAQKSGEDGTYYVLVRRADGTTVLVEDAGTDPEAVWIDLDGTPLAIIYKENAKTQKTCIFHWIALAAAALMLALLIILRSKNKKFRWILYGVIAAALVALAVLAMVNFGCYATVIIAAVSVITGAIIVVKT